MTTRTQATAAPIIIKLAGKDYRMSPLTDKNIAELDEWLQSKIINMTRRSLPEDSLPDERREIMQAAIAQAATMSWMSGEGVGIMSTLDGWAQILWQGLRSNHPELTAEIICQKLLDPITLQNAQQTFERLNIGPKIKKGVSKTLRKKRRR